MLRSWFLGLLVLVSFCRGLAQAGEFVCESGPTKVHLLELFTSEGCSSCPSAETWLAKLKQNPGLWREFVPVAFHVDYWDYLGWRDRFASKQWTLRQQTYADRWKARSIYTPGLVMDGNESRLGQVPQKSQDAIGTLRLALAGNAAVLTFKPAQTETREYEVYVAQLGFALSSDVSAGENRGRKLGHDFVVLSSQKTAFPAASRAVTIALEKTDVSNPGALAAWVTHAGDQTPIQATGGWLTKN
jgi:hypothetical protein